MSQRQLDEAVLKIRNEQVDDETVKTAAGRVFSNLFDSSFIAAEPTGSGKIRNCADVRSLIPAYLNRTLSSPRALLVDDHILHCVDCRRALQEARGGAILPPPIAIDRARRRKVPVLVWAAAACLALGISLGLTGLLPGQNSLRATVASVQGSIYKVTDLSVSLVEAGEILKNTDELRTAKGSHALLRLAGGATLEIAERSDVAFSGTAWHGTNVNLARGQMIVDARNASRKSFNVTSGDMTIPVNGGVVAVDHGTKESRVAVANGSFAVHVGASTQTLTAGYAGRQDGGELRLINLPMNSEFAWSQNPALLNELAGLQKDIQAIPSPGLRYATNLAQYLPADTFVYAAVPNLGGTITEARKLFNSRLAESDTLRQWWQQKPFAKNGDFDRMVDQISSISSYLGDEIIVAAGGAGAKDAAPVFMAEIKQPGLAQYLQTNLPTAAQVQIITAGTPLASGGKLLIEVDNNVLVAASTAAQLKQVEDVVQHAATGGFIATPFFARINQVYKNGAGYFVAANLEQIGAKSVTKSKTSVPVGFDNVQYLVLERKGDSEMRASVSFDGARQGLASWLGAPGPAGSLNFVSPDASFAASVVMKNPRVMMQELLGMVGTKELDDFEAKAGVNLLDDVAAPLGSDVTLAMDGGLTPILAVEVYDATRLQQTLNTFITQFNNQASPKAGHLKLSKTQVNGRDFFSIANDKAPGLAANYTFVDGYLVASSSQANVLLAIQNKQSGNILADSANFRAQLPSDGYPNFSALIYTHLDPAIGSLAKQLKSSEKQQELTALLSQGGSGLVCVYGEPDRILATARGSFLGFNLGTLVGLQQGQPLKTIIGSAKGADARPPVNTSNPLGFLGGALDTAAVLRVRENAPIGAVKGVIN